MENEILLELTAPNGNLYVVVECDERVCFMYLCSVPDESGQPDPNFRTKSVWVRNLVDPPAELDVEGLKQGRPPLLPAPHCRHQKAQAKPNPDELRVVWLPEGNGVALLECDEVIAIIPPWSGQDGFDGYARDVVGESPFAWELSAENVLLDRFEKAERYWESWDTDLWDTTQASQIAALESAFGEHANYYAIDGGIWPPKAMLRFRNDQWQVLATIGVSLRPQPNIETYFAEPSIARRIELAVALPADLGEDAVKRIAGYLSAQSSYPWSRYTWFGSGHTIPCDSWSQSIYTYAALTDTSPLGVMPKFEPVFGDPVNLIWFVPITAGEQKLAASTTTEELLSGLPPERWKEG